MRFTPWSALRSLGEVEEESGGISMAENMAMVAKHRADAILAELLNNWGVARRLWGGAYILKPGGSNAFWKLFDIDFYGDIARDPRVVAAIQREVDRFEDLARRYPGVQVLPEGSSTPAGSGPQPATLTINFSTGGDVQWLKGMSPAELGERLIDLNISTTAVPKSAVTATGGSGSGGGSAWTAPSESPAGSPSSPSWVPMAAAAGALGLILMMGGRR